MSDDVEYNVKGLENFLKALKEKPPVARIGVLSDGKRKDGASNVEIGVKHEFGSDGMPVRSFLRMPISDNMQKYLDESGVINPAVIDKFIQNGSLKEFVSVIGEIGFTIVQDAFQSNGFGKWPAWKTPGYTSRTGLILVDTQQLRDSIQMDVKS